MEDEALRAGVGASERDERERVEEDEREVAFVVLPDVFRVGVFLLMKRISTGVAPTLRPAQVDG